MSLFPIIANTIPTGHTLNVVLNTPGSGVYSPPAWLLGLEITVQCTGAGANGADYGGGGGEFAQSNVVIAGDTLYLVDSPGVGVGATIWDYTNTEVPQATSSFSQDGGTGGTGDYLHNGGDGGNASAGAGGGGGSSASPTNAGVNGTDAVTTTPGTGGVPVGSPAGTGGNGSITTGADGTTPGAGGGGGLVAGGAGANGQIVLIYPAL